MNKVVVIEVIGQKIWVKNLKLDSDYTDYSYQNPVPIINNTNDEVGLANIKKSGRDLYADLQLYRLKDYNNLYPQILFNVYGKINAVVLSCTPGLDQNIGSIEDQLQNGKIS